MLEPGDLLLNITGDGVTFARACEVPPDVLPACVNQHVSIIRVNRSVADPGFVLGYLTHPLIKPYIESFNAGGSRRAITKGHIESFEIPLPPLTEQRAVSRILRTLDNKIELNHQMRETLEAMAHALFKSWFVDFDPVRAKTEGRDPGVPERLANLFSNHLVHSQIGEIPDGWDVRPFSDTVDVIGGGTPKTSVAEYWGGHIPWFSVVDAPYPSDAWVIDTEKKITHAGLDNSATRMLSVGTTIISARGTVGRVALVGTPMAMNQSCYALRARVGARGFFNYFVASDLVRILQQRAHGSIFDTITRETLAGVNIVVPPSDLVDAFESHVENLMQRVRLNLSESRTLAALRDTLLPKLISGELSVKDAEPFVGSAV